jgi:Zn-dependent peptidase ImmA (M78 family)
MLDPIITRAAEELLARGRVIHPPVPVHKLAELAGAELRSGAMPPELSGFLLRQGGRPVIGVNTAQVKVRQRFTVAHELGHLLLHPDESYVDRGFSVYYRDEKSATAEDLAEMQANQFAADLLMPRAMLESLLRGKQIDLDDEDELGRVAKRFEVSSQALTFRLINLGLAAGPRAGTPSRRRR